MLWQNTIKTVKTTTFKIVQQERNVQFLREISWLATCLEYNFYHWTCWAHLLRAPVIKKIMTKIPVRHQKLCGLINETKSQLSCELVYVKMYEKVLRWKVKSTTLIMFKRYSKSHDISVFISASELRREWMLSAYQCWIFQQRSICKCSEQWRVTVRTHRRRNTEMMYDDLHTLLRCTT